MFHGDGEEAPQPGARHDEAQEGPGRRSLRQARARPCSPRSPAACSSSPTPSPRVSTPQTSSSTRRVQSIVIERRPATSSPSPTASSILADNVVFTTPAYVTADIVQQLDPVARRTSCARSATSPPRPSRSPSAAAKSPATSTASASSCPPPKAAGSTPAPGPPPSSATAHPTTSFCMRVFIGGAFSRGPRRAGRGHAHRHRPRGTPRDHGHHRNPGPRPRLSLDTNPTRNTTSATARDRRDRPAPSAHPGLYLAGAAYRGSGIPDCIQSGMIAAQSQSSTRNPRTTLHPHARPAFRLQLRRLPMSSPTSIKDIRSIPIPAPTTHGHPSTHPQHSSSHSYSDQPMLVYWEMTQACGLACRHCRAEAVSTPHPDELTTEEEHEPAAPDRRLRQPHAAPHLHRRRSAAAAPTSSTSSTKRARSASTSPSLPAPPPTSPTKSSPSSRRTASTASA